MINDDYLIENEKNDEYSELMKDILSIYEQDRDFFSIELQDLLNFIQVHFLTSFLFSYLIILNLNPPNYSIRGLLDY